MRRAARWTVGVLVASALVACAHGGKGTPAATVGGIEVPPEVYTPADRDALLSPRDVLQRIEASPKLYEFGESEGIVDPEVELRRYWPEEAWTVDTPRVLTDAKGVRRVVAAPLPKEAEALLVRAREQLAAKRFTEAAQAAEQASTAAPGDSRPWTVRGEAELGAGRPAGAIAFYEKAIGVNPDDARAYALRGEVLLQLQRAEEARRSFAQALALRPRDPALVKRLRGDDALPFTVAPAVIAPRVQLRPRNDDLLILVDATAPHWFAYGMCKALWEGEPGMRKERTGAEAHRFTALEEQECLVTLGVTYLLSRDNDEEEFAPDEDVERVMAVHDDQLENALVLYELASRRFPAVTLVVPEQQREEVVRFVLEYVLVPRGDAPPPKDDDDAPTQRYEARR